MQTLPLSDALTEKHQTFAGERKRGEKTSFPPQTLVCVSHSLAVCHIYVCIHLYSMTVGVRKRAKRKDWKKSEWEGAHKQNESQGTVVLFVLWPLGLRLTVHRCTSWKAFKTLQSTSPSVSASPVHTYTWEKERSGGWSCVPHHFMAALGLMSPALSPSASLGDVYNPEMGDGDGTHGRFYRSAGDRGTELMCGIRRQDLLHFTWTSF